MKELTITEKNFEEEVLKSELPVLLDFWAPWCGPCRMLAPTIEELAEEYDGKLKVGKVNSDEEPKLSIQHNILSIPCLVLYKDGEIQGTLIGLRDKEEIVQWIGL